MSEAIISRFGGGEGAEISNETKAALGLTNNATLDDCLRIVALQDPNYATMLVSLKYPDGSPVVGEQIQMTDVGGGNLVYTTDGAGQCIFKTANQSANIIDYNCVYFDLNPAETQLVDCPVGTVKPITLTRSTKGNGYNVKITSNGNYKFSHMLNTIDVYIASGSGGGGYGYYGWYNISSFTATYSSTTYNLKKIGGRGGNANYNNIIGYQVTPNINYEINIGSGGVGGRTVGSEYYYGTGANQARANSNAAGPFNVNIIGSVGNTGGTSKFGSIISATGGVGGGAGSSSSNGTNYGNGGAGATTFRISRGDYESRSMMNNWTVTYHGYVYSNADSGSIGWCWLNNFQYKC